MVMAYDNGRPRQYDNRGAFSRRAEDPADFFTAMTPTSRRLLLPQALVAEKATTTMGLVISLTEGQDAGLQLDRCCCSCSCANRAASRLALRSATFLRAP